MRPETTKPSRSGRLAVALLMMLACEGLALALIGSLRAEEAQSEYPFRERPTKVLSVLTGLPEAKALARFYTPAEIQLLRDARSDSLGKLSLAEAALLACGVKDSDRREKYLGQIDRIEADARREIGDAKSPREIGKRLLAFLHRGPMSAGYTSHQADLTLLLDTGHFNCVSSAMMYAILADRLGLEFEAVEVPEHVFLTVYDGKKWVDVEPTNAKGFDRALDRPSLEKLREKYADSAESGDNFRRPVSKLGLVAIAYFCHGSSEGKDGRHDAAISYKLFALEIDPSNGHAVKSTLTEIKTWCGELIDDGKSDAALNLATNYAHELKNPAPAKSLIHKASLRITK